jgi:hypothetical protein
MVRFQYPSEGIRLHLGAKREVSKDGNNFVGERRGTDRTSNNDVHPPLRIANHLIVHREQLNENR